MHQSVFCLACRRFIFYQVRDFNAASSQHLSKFIFFFVIRFWVCQSDQCFIAYFADSVLMKTLICCLAGCVSYCVEPVSIFVEPILFEHMGRHRNLNRLLLTRLTQYHHWSCQSKISPMIQIWQNHYLLNRIILQPCYFYELKQNCKASELKLRVRHKAKMAKPFQRRYSAKQAGIALAHVPNS